MNPCDPILFRELPVIRKIIEDETWLESERRGCRVGSDDRVVRDRVCQIILRIGQQLRDSLSASVGYPSGQKLANEGPASAETQPPPPANQAT